MRATITKFKNILIMVMVAWSVEMVRTIIQHTPLTETMSMNTKCNEECLRAYLEGSIIIYHFVSAKTLHDGNSQASVVVVGEKGG